jgi:hypothetical protein
MAMICIRGGECTGCMDCREPEEYYCPICGERVFEIVYVSTDGDVVGCENCVNTKEPYEVLGE